MGKTAAKHLQQEPKRQLLYIFLGVQVEAFATPSRNMEELRNPGSDQVPGDRAVLQNVSTAELPIVSRRTWEFRPNAGFNDTEVEEPGDFRVKKRLPDLKGCRNLVLRQPSCTPDELTLLRHSGMPQTGKV